ncbi:MAG: hypothetical protein J1E61_08915 [Lachnospiraceae bacterium]|nr:hypothetical protein [Lachnospiraceae bacterium]
MGERKGRRKKIPPAGIFLGHTVKSRMTVIKQMGSYRKKIFEPSHQDGF